MVKYMSSYFIEELQDELEILSRLFELETGPSGYVDVDQIMTEEGSVASDLNGFNCLVDLCGIFKKTSVYEVKSLLLQKFGTDQFRYIYHIDPIGNVID